MGNMYIDDLVSIIMPSYNGAIYIRDAIDSVLKQTYNNWEMLLVDDCSSDSTDTIIKGYSDTRIKYIRLSENSGVARARNKGLNNAKGRFIAFLDSDDVWLEDKLSTQIDFMLACNIDFSFTQYRQFKNDITNPFKLIDVPEKVDYKSLLKQNAIGCSTVMLDRQGIPVISMPEAIKHEDYVTWLRILKSGVTAYGLKKDLVRYRLSGDSLSNNKFKSAFWTWEIYKNIERFSLPEAMYYFTHYTFNGIKKHYL